METKIGGGFMRRILKSLGLASFFAVTLSAQAAQAHTLLLSYASGGRAVSPEGLSVRQVCEIYDDALVMKRIVGEFKTEETRPLSFTDTLDEFKAAITDTLSGTIVEVERLPVGITFDVYDVYAEDGTAQLLQLSLGERIFRKNNARATDNLIKVANLHCGLR